MKENNDAKTAFLLIIRNILHYSRGYFLKLFLGVAPTFVMKIDLRIPQIAGNSG